LKTLTLEQNETAAPIGETPAARGAVPALALSMLLSSLGTSIANVGLPTLTHAFAASLSQVQWVVLAYLLAITTLIVSIGRLGDILGRRRLLLAGILLFTLASLLCSMAPTLSLLILARAAQGIGAAAMMALTVAFVSEAVPKGDTGKAMGVLATMSATGTALGPSLGGFLIAGLGWRALFVVHVPLGLVALLLAYRALPEDREGNRPSFTRFDARGTLLLASALAAYALAMTNARGGFGSFHLALLFAAAVSGGLFVLSQARAAFPLLPLAAFRRPSLNASLAMSALVSTVVMATMVIGPFHLSGALGLDPAMVGLVLSVGPLAAALTGVPAGRLVDRFGARRATFAGLGGMATGCVALSLTAASFGVAGYLAPLVAITAGYGMFQTANNTAVMGALQPDQRGVISGMLSLSRNLGLITGASAMGAVFASAATAGELATASANQIAAGTRVTFAVATGLIAVAFALAAAGQTTANRRAVDNRP
jgi:EmrB/QacA subfamily drug resistance transporter